MNNVNDTERTSTINPRIYVASLADYNAGTLLGRWIDAARGADRIKEEIAQLLAESSEPIAEEWGIFDYEGFCGYSVGEYESIDHVAEVATSLVEYGEVFGKLLAHFGGDLEETTKYMKDAYCGEFENLSAYAEDLLGEAYAEVLTNLPNLIRYNIDWEAIAQDLELSGDIFTVEVGRTIHVFYGNV